MPAHEATIPATDEGLLRGDGAFEVIRVYDGRPFAVPDHLDRIERSAANLRLDDVPRSELESEIPELLEERGGAEFDGCLRIVLTRGGQRLLLTEPLPAAARAVRLGVVEYAPTRVLDGVKSLSYGANMLCAPAGARARLRRGAPRHAARPRARGADVVALLGGRRRRRSARRRSSEHILASITRHRVMEVADVERAAVHDGRPQGGDARRSSPRPPARRSRSRRSRSSSCPTASARARWRRRSRQPHRRGAGCRLILTVIGNRPQFVKAAAVSRRLRERCRGGHRPHRPALRRRAVAGLLRGARRAGARTRELNAGGGHEHRPDRAHPRGARAGARRSCEPDAGARLRRHQLDARRRARGGAGGHPGRPRRGGHALLRPRDARGAEPRADRPRERPAAVLDGDRRAQPRARGRGGRGASSWAT